MAVARTCGGCGVILIVDERESVVQGYAGSFKREGVAATALCASEVEEWFDTASSDDVMAIDAVLLGSCETRDRIPSKVRAKSKAAVIALNDERSLDETLQLFAAGVDDVVRKPVHVREILARIAAIKRRDPQDGDGVKLGALRVFFDGRDPEVASEPMRLPRRELRILEYLVSNRGRRMTRESIFNYVYGIFNDQISDHIIESHISKLRKRLRQQLGYDPIDCQRYLGYRLDLRD